MVRIGPFGTGLVPVPDTLGLQSTKGGLLSDVVYQSRTTVICKLTKVVVGLLRPKWFFVITLHEGSVETESLSVTVRTVEVVRTRRTVNVKSNTKYTTSVLDSITLISGLSTQGKRPTRSF